MGENEFGGIEADRRAAEFVRSAKIQKTQCRIDEMKGKKSGVVRAGQLATEEIRNNSLNGELSENVGGQDFAGNRHEFDNFGIGKNGDDLNKNVSKPVSPARFPEKQYS